MPLTEEEKVRVRSHLGYLNVADVQTFVLGTPASVETQFIIEGAMNKVLEAALPYVRNVLGECEGILTQLRDNRENLAVKKLGDIELNDREFEQLRQRYDFWKGKLADAFGVYENPFSKVPGGGINGPVVG